MPSGAKKRKAAKKKKINDSSTTNPSQNASVDLEKKEDGLIENKFKDGNGKEGGVGIEVGSKSKSSNRSSTSSSSSGSSEDESCVVDKNIVVVESAPNELVPVVESVPENSFPVVDPVKPVDSLLEEVSQVFDEMKNDRRKDLGVEETPVVVEEQTAVVRETGVDDECVTPSVVAESVLKENEVEKGSSAAKDCVLSSMPPKNLVSEANVAEHADETDTIKHSNKQAPAASTAVAVQSRTTWKSCCGIFELFSGSER